MQKIYIMKHKYYDRLGKSEKKRCPSHCSITANINAFCINFLHNFQSNILDLFDPSFSQKLSSDWVYFLLGAEPDYRKVGEVTPPPPPMLWDL